MNNQSESFRIVGISGSLRSGSFSTAILTALRDRCWAGTEFTIVTIQQIPLFNQDLDREPPLPPVASLRAAVAEADAVVIATPEYNHGVPGVLKNALDWASRPAFRSCFRYKPVLIVTSAPSIIGGVRAQYQLRETLTSMFAQVLPGPEVVIGNVDTKMSNGVFTDEANLDFMASAMDQLHEEVRSRRKMAA